MHDLDILRALVAELKAAPIFAKADKAEKIMDRVIGCLAEQGFRLSQLEERVGQKHGGE